MRIFISSHPHHQWINSKETEKTTSAQFCMMNREDELLSLNFIFYFCNNFLSLIYISLMAILNINILIILFRWHQILSFALVGTYRKFLLPHTSSFYRAIQLFSIADLAWTFYHCTFELVLSPSPLFQEYITLHCTVHPHVYTFCTFTHHSSWDQTVSQTCLLTWTLKMRWRRKKMSLLCSWPVSLGRKDCLWVIKEKLFCERR